MNINFTSYSPLQFGDAKNKLIKAAAAGTALVLGATISGAAGHVVQNALDASESHQSELPEGSGAAGWGIAGAAGTAAYLNRKRQR